MVIDLNAYRLLISRYHGSRSGQQAVHMMFPYSYNVSISASASAIIFQVPMRDPSSSLVHAAVGERESGYAPLTQTS